MRNLDRALADITSIRSQLAAGTMFRGFGPAVIAATGGLALVTAGAQSVWPDELAREPFVFLMCWAATAVVSAALIGAEMLARSRRHHAGLADAMILNAIEQFLPAGFAGGAIAGVLLIFAPEALWILPGLWQILVALGIFASVRTLPRSITLVGAWYFVAGICVLIIASFSQTLSPQNLSPWSMGLPFAIGQFLMAAVLHFASGEHDADG
jgi:hypothetical protein